MADTATALTLDEECGIDERPSDRQQPNTCCAVRVINDECREVVGCEHETAANNDDDAEGRRGRANDGRPPEAADKRDEDNAEREAQRREDDDSALAGSRVPLWVKYTFRPRRNGKH